MIFADRTEELDALETAFESPGSRPLDPSRIVRRIDTRGVP